MKADGTYGTTADHSHDHIGTIGATVSAMTGALLIGRTNVMKTASFIIALHSMKAVALAKSEIDNIKICMAGMKECL